jgi:hypothetical protein
MGGEGVAWNKIMNTCVISQVPVYWRSTPGKQVPDFFVSRAESLRMREAGQAYPIQRGRALRMMVAEARLTPEPVRVQVRDESCRMGEAIIFANACGEARAVAMTEGWKNQPQAASS